MLKPTYINVIIFIFLKYLIFYIFMMFKNDNYYLVNPGIKNAFNLFYYLWMFLSLPLVISIIFSVPIYYLFKIKKIIYFIFISVVVLAIEYAIYTYFVSQLDLWNGIYNMIIGVVLFIIFFRNSIKLDNFIIKNPAD